MPTPDYSVDLDLGEPPPELIDYAHKNLGEDPNTRLQAIYELREMIYERGECTPHRMDDDFLIKFLRARKFIPKRAHRLVVDMWDVDSAIIVPIVVTANGLIAKSLDQHLRRLSLGSWIKGNVFRIIYQLIVNYYQFKEDNPELFENVFPLDLRKIGDANVIAVPPYRDQDGRRLLFYRIGCWNPKAIPVEDLFKATIMAMELGLLEQRSQILGGVAVFDLEDIGTQHAWQITPSVASKIVKLMVSCFPMSTYAIHIINHSWLFDKIYNIFKPLLNSNMRSSIYFHGHDHTSLHKHILPAHLPERYGGIWPDYSYTVWLNSLKKNYEVAKEVIGYGYNFREEEVDPEVARQLKENGIKLY